MGRQKLPGSPRLEGPTRDAAATRDGAAGGDMRRHAPRHRPPRGTCLTVLALLALAPCAPSIAQTTASRIRLDTVGYLPGHEKRASGAARFSEFKVIREPGGAVAFRGESAGPLHNEDTGEEIYFADFSALREPGAYVLAVTGVGRSAPFRVGRDVYDAAFRSAFTAMYLWRCGSAVRATHEGVTFSHAACHLEDARLDFVGGGRSRRDAAGGWHDAGDYNRPLAKVISQG